MILSRPVTPSPAPAPAAGGPVGPARREGFELPAHPWAVHDARDRVVGQLLSWGLSEGLGETARLVVSEFFTNAVVHTASRRIRCQLQLRSQRLRIEIGDEGGGRTEVVPRTAGIDDVGGRGLQLVSALTDRWGVAPARRGRGRVVWAELCTRAEGSGSVPSQRHG